MTSPSRVELAARAVRVRDRRWVEIPSAATRIRKTADRLDATTGLRRPQRPIRVDTPTGRASTGRSSITRLRSSARACAPLVAALLLFGQGRREHDVQVGVDGGVVARSGLRLAARDAVHEPFQRGGLERAHSAQQLVGGRAEGPYVGERIGALAGELFG